MLQAMMLTRVIAESVVGWYCTGSSDVLSSTSARIHELFADVCEVDQSVFLTVDTELTNSRLGVNAFTAETIAVIIFILSSILSLICVDAISE